MMSSASANQEYFKNCFTKSLVPPNDHDFPEIPWLEKRIKPVSVQMNTTGGKTRWNENNEKRRLAVALSVAVPVYLPGSFHQMRCVRRPNTSLSDIELHCEGAFRFLYCCSTLHHNHMPIVINIGKNEKILSTLKLPFQESKKKREPVPLQCSTAAEFLLEPWILIQMLFQPVLLHQWATALLAEALVFEKKISPIFIYGSPLQMTNITKNLRRMLSIMKNCANHMFTAYATMRGRRQQYNFNNILYYKTDNFSNHLAQVLPILEFVTSEEASSVIDDIESICLAELNDKDDDILTQVHLDFFDFDEEPIPIYDFWFWTTDCDPGRVFTGADDPYRGKYKNDKEERKEMNCDPNKILSGVMVEDIIRTGRLKGVDLEEITASVEKIYDDLSIDLSLMNQYKVISLNDEIPMRDGRCGVIYNMLCLYSDVKISKIYDIMTRKIFEEVKQTHNQVKICNPSAKPSGKKFHEIESMIDKLFTNKKWTWDEILADVKLSTCSTDETYNFDVKKVAEHFQGRIKRLVYRTAEKHLTTLTAGRFEFVPEHQFVQYALPCFVLHFLGLCKDPSVGAAGKQNYMRFIDSLITNYEQHEYVQALSPDKKEPLQKLRDSHYCNSKHNPHVLNQLLKKFMHDKVTSLNISRLIISFLGEYITEVAMMNSYIEQRIDFLGHSNWFIQIDMFMNRAITVLNDLTHTSNEPLNKMLQISGKFETAINALEQHYFDIFTQYIKACIKVFDATKIFTDDVGLTCKRSDLNMTVGNVSKAMIKSAQKLSCLQLAGLLVFLQFGNHDKRTPHSHWAKKYQGPGFPMDLSSILIWCVAINDQWKIKQLVGPMLKDDSAGRRGKRTKDNSLVSISVIRSNPCYERVLQMITPEGRVRMQHPGEITFVPVKHCRWCGLIEAEKFRLCPECFACPEYCDLNYFCSEKCETEALDFKHREEHARYYEVKLGLNN